MKDILILGGSSDIGSKIIDLLKKDQWNITATFNSTKKQDTSSNWKKTDITKIKEIDSLYSSLDNLDAVIFSAMPEITTDIDDIRGFKKDVLPYLEGYIRAYTNTVQKLKQNGKIITLSGQSVRNGLPEAPYMAANFAFINNLNKSLSTGKNPKNIQTCDLLLGPVNTKMWSRIDDKIKNSYFDEQSPEKYFLEPVEVAKKVIYLLEQDRMQQEILFDKGYGNTKC